MPAFPYAHSGHAQWQTAVALVLVQLRNQLEHPAYASTPTLALLYLTDHYAEVAPEILATLQSELPWVTDWSGTVGVGICANNTEYFDVPGLSLMLLDLPSDQYRVFSGVSPLGIGFEAHTALVHADGRTPDIDELIRELSQRTDSGFLFGGLSCSRGEPLQFAVAGNGNINGHGAANGVFRGGLSGVAFADGVSVVSRVTQGCKPVAREHTVTAADGNLLLELDHQPALKVLMDDLGISLEAPQFAMEVLRTTLLGLAEGGGTLLQQTGNFGNQVMVRGIIGLDPARSGVAVGSPVDTGMRVAFCQRNRQAARADLVRICAEIRDELETEGVPSVTALLTAGGVTAGVAAGPATPGTRIAGAVYVSCVGRGGPHFGAPHAELQVIRRTLGDVPLVGFFADGEIGYDHIYGYTGVLTVFTTRD